MGVKPPQPAATDAVDLVTDLVETLLPSMDRFGIATACEVGQETLARRILAEVGSNVTLVGRVEVGAWTRKPQ